MLLANIGDHDRFKSRISHLQNENRRLQTRLASVVETPSNRGVAQLSPPSSSSDLGQANVDSIELGNTSPILDLISRGENGVLAPSSSQRPEEYRPRASARTSLDLPPSGHADPDGVELIQKQLRAEAANQRK